MINVAICDDVVATTGKIETMLQNIAKRNFIPIDEYSNAIVHAFQKFKAPFSGKIVHIFPEQSAVI